MTAETAPLHILARYAGRKPAAPKWFEEALALMPDRHRVASEGAEIEYFTWGEAGQPGLLFLHGGGAHALWWAHIAPFFAKGYRVAAMSMSGMGGSDWRDRYSIAQHARDMRAVAKAAGLLDAGKAVIVGHSFGGAPTATAAADPDQWVERAFIIDSSLDMRHSPANGQPEPRARRHFESFEQGLARFRFLPPQECENDYIADMIARDSLVEIEGKGWSWKADPNSFLNTDRLDSRKQAKNARCPLAIIYGDRSWIMDEEALAKLRRDLPDTTPFIAIPDCAHHVMVDQPLALVATMRTLLES
ncbi:alpha/beta fold hydrolase [Parasphingopyxis marina]|uniref:Alpha/beta hydrolase n=1 Tax=Parasphingopyxis marina TaxID=2761622 RepID=A0A842I114_9SPHN|nr:alpha/beta hydrolase [Parasphingopyxis marina]MBC2778557.1 alpha/beta hydrolase [Parasphingopyxis marina]